jgi:uncharacterized protein
MSKTAVITGATSGIGAAFARKLAQNGYDLIITGRKKDIIQKLADDLSQRYGIKVNVVIAELSNDSDFQKLSDAVKSKENIEILVNNAGYSGYARHFEEVDIAEHEKMVKVHQLVPMRLVSLIVPDMIKRRKGAIINVASVASFLYVPSCSVYCATKAFLKLFSQCLYLELKDKGIMVQALCPGFTESNFAKEYYSNEMLKQLTKSKAMSPEKVVDCSLNNLKKNKPICIPGLSNQMMARMFPPLPTGIYSSLQTRMSPWR